MITVKQKIEILEKGLDVCKKAIAFKYSLNDWTKFICKFDFKELESITNNNAAIKQLSNEMKRVSKEIEELIS